jgi:hypothetical protein
LKLATVKLALATTETLCREIERLQDDLVTATEALGYKIRLHRHIPWQMHVEQIENIIKSNKSA